MTSEFLSYETKLQHMKHKSQNLILSDQKSFFLIKKNPKICETICEHENHHYIKEAHEHKAR